MVLATPESSKRSRKVLQSKWREESARCSRCHALRRDPDSAGSGDRAAFSLARKATVTPSLAVSATDVLPGATCSPKCAPGRIGECFCPGDFPWPPSTAHTRLASLMGVKLQLVAQCHQIQSSLGSNWFPAGDGGMSLPWLPLDLPLPGG